MKFLKLSLLLVIITLTSCKTAKYPDLSDGMYADIQTSKGDILIQLEQEKTPMTVANFVSLAEGTNNFVDEKYKGKRFFDGLKFHRVVANFMIQGGDPLGTGGGNPGYRFKDEFDETLTHSGEGILSMANSGKATNGSQFFITHKATPHLNGRHTVFGHVVKGQDIVNAIAKNDVIDRVDIIRNGKTAKSFDAPAIFTKHFNSMEADAKAAAEKLKIEKDAIAKEAKGKIKNFLESEAKATKTKSGLKILVTKKGSGAKPKKGQKVTIHYSGYLRNGKLFDSSLTKNKPFETAIGVGRVIPGWDEGVMQLNVGSKALLYIPSHLAYGKRGAGGAIPPNADLIFEVELLGVK